MMDAAVLQVSKPMSGEINSLFHFDSVETFFKTIIIFFDLFSIQWIIICLTLSMDCQAHGS